VLQTWKQEALPFYPKPGRKGTLMKLVVWRRFCSGRVKQWAVLDKADVVLFKSEHKGSCVTVMRLLKEGKTE